MKRTTVQRDLVLDVVNQLKCHATAEEIYETIIKTHPTVSHATVYRNLNKFAKLGKILKVEVPNGADCFDHMCHNHYHVKCEHCGKVYDVEMDYMKDIESKIKNTQGFKFTGHSIVFSGICPNCQISKGDEKNEKYHNF